MKDGGGMKRAVLKGRAGAKGGIAALLLAVAGCGTWLGNPKNPDPGTEKPKGDSMVTLNILGDLQDGAGLTTLSAIPVIGRDGTEQGTLTLSTAQLALEKISIRLHDSDTTERQEFDGPYVVDLIAGSLSPDPGTIELPAGNYKAIKLALHKLEEEEAGGLLPAGDPLVDNSIHLAGTYVPAGGGAIPFTMTFELDEEFKIRTGASFAGMDVAAGETNAVIIAFRLGRWFDFTGAEEDFDALTGSTITLAKGTGGEAAKRVREAIKENIKGSAKFGKDHDRSGKLESAEGSDDEDED